MEYLYGALLLHKAGKEITEDALEKTLIAAGIKADKAKVKATATALKGVDIDKVLSETQVATMPKVEAPAEKPAAEAKKKEEPSAEEQKKTEEEAAAGLGALFG